MPLGYHVAQTHASWGRRGCNRDSLGCLSCSSPWICLGGVCYGSVPRLGMSPVIDDTTMCVLFSKHEGSPQRVEGNGQEPLLHLFLHLVSVCFGWTRRELSASMCNSRYTTATGLSCTVDRLSHLNRVQGGARFFQSSAQVRTGFFCSRAMRGGI